MKTTMNIDGRPILEPILDHLPVGISVIDRDLNIVAINRALVELLDFPQSMFAQRLPTLEELTRFNARRGEYGPGDEEVLVAQRMALARRAETHHFRRTRPNGRVLEITGQPLPDGGFVTIYVDVTAREQAEEALREKALYLSSVVDHLAQGISVFDAQLRMKCWNSVLLDVLELPPESVYPDVPFDDLIMYPARRGEYGPGDPTEHVAARRALAMKFEAHRFERTRPNGRTHLVEGRPMRMDGQIVGFVTSYTDITEQKASERELRRTNEVFQTLVDNIPGGVTLFDADLRLVACNAEFKRLLDLPDALFENSPTLERFFRFNVERGEYGGCGRGDIEATVAQLLDRARQRQAHKFERTRPDGTVLEVRGLPLADGGFVTIYTDVTERHRAAEAIERLAHRDALTGLANRYTLEARLDQLVADARRHSRKLAVMFIDMDNFKTINDTLGHAIGDEFLVAVARRLSATVRDNDIVARLGGDEFVLVLSDIDELGDVTTVASKVTRALACPIRAGGHELRSSASVGICVYPDDGKDRGALMQSADIAMYHAKNDGKGVFRFFDVAMMTAANERLELERALQDAISRGEFVLHYQPQLAAATHRASGVEALIRWQRPDGELTPPARFIPLAEETGLINAIGDWVLREACRTVAAWRREGLDELCVAVNLSALQLSNPELPQAIAAALADTGLPAQALTLEVTESVAMENPPGSIAVLGAIRALGVRLAMDDFGTGYSSLAYLKLLPLDCLKLDRSFVAELESNNDDAAISAATIGLAHNLGLAVIAEGVETPGQHGFLARLDCDAFQGFLFSRPLPAEQAKAWLLENRLTGIASWEI